jgi:predicted metal-dependent hydrolase
MGRIPSPNQSEFFEDSFDQSVDSPPIRIADRTNDGFPSWRPSLNNLDPLALFSGLEPIAFARYLITFLIGAAVALAWQSHSFASREVDSLKALSLDHDAVQQSIDRIATRIIISQEEITRRIERAIDRLAAGQEQTMSAISDLQTVEQYFLERVSTPPPRSASATGPKLVQRPSQASTALAPAKSP